MKRIFAMLFALCLLLCACGGEPEPTEAPTTEATTEATTEVTTEATTEATTVPEIYQNPLNGEVLDAPYTGRPAAVVINNLKDALPHYGVSQADFYYELETEGGITRCLMIFSDPTKAGVVGPVRSSRTFFNSIAVSYDAPIFHCGGSVRGRNAGYEDSTEKIQNWMHVDQMSKGKYYYRDEDRYNKYGYNWEHTLFTKGEKIAAAMTDLGYISTDEQDYGLTFQENVQLSGSAASKVIISFSWDKTSTFTYDTESGVYQMSQYGKDYVDADNDTRIAFENVIALYTKQWSRHDGEYSRSYYTLVGEGNGYLAIHGQIVPIKWSRESLEKPFAYTYEDGTPVTLNMGKTYVAVTSVDSDAIVYE